MSVTASAITELTLGALAVRAVGLAFLAGTVALIAAYSFKRYTREELPEGASLLLGIGAVAVYLNTRIILIQFLGDQPGVVTLEAAAVNIGLFFIAGLAADGGHRFGTSLATSATLSSLFLPTSLQSTVSPLVRATGRSITVTLPDADTIADIDGYDPVTEEAKTALGGETLTFSRGLTVDELRTQLTTRLKDDYDVGYVDLELETDGTVTYLGVGRRPAGLGPTLQPGMDATAIRADPAFSATPGDSIQIWTPGDGQRVGTAELRASVGSVTTVVADESVTRTLDPTVNYRLMTLSSESKPERDFAGMLRRADETLSVVSVGDRSPLIGLPVGGLDVTLIAIRTPEGKTETIPSRERALAAGDQLFALGKPAALRQLEAGARAEAETPPEGDTYEFAEGSLAETATSGSNTVSEADSTEPDTVSETDPAEADSVSKLDQDTTSSTADTEHSSSESRDEDKNK